MQTHIRHTSRHVGFSYPVSWSQRMYSIFLAPLLVVLAVAAILFAGGIPVSAFEHFDTATAITAFIATFARLFLAFALSLLCAIPLSLLITSSASAERVFLPLFDIIQSIPILAFFPVIVLVFIRTGALNGAVIFILFLNMLWNIVFSLVGGLKAIPQDMKWAAAVLKIRGGKLLRSVTLPAVVPYLITGSLLAWAQGWNIIIVAEVLHTYVPQGVSADDVFGIGSAMVHAASQADTPAFLLSLLVLVAGIAVMNFTVWQKLLHYGERYKFE